MTGVRPSVLTALPDAWDSAVVAALAPRVVVGRRCVDLADLLAGAEAGLGDVALVSPQLRGLDLSAVRDLRLCGVGVVALVAEGDDAGEARLRQIGVRTVVRPDVPPADLYAAVVEGLAAPREPVAQAPAPGVGEPEGGPSPEGTGQVVVVWGPGGSPGRTTVAVNLAWELALAGRRVVLADLDTHGASVAQHLAVLDESAGVAVACRAADSGTLDLAALRRLLPPVAPGLRLLSGLPAPERWPEVRAGAVERVLDLLRLDCDVVVVDVGASLEDDEELSYDTLAPRRNMAALAALESSDQLVVVGAADPVGLQRLVRGVHDLRERGWDADHLVVNKVRAGAVGPRPASRVDAVLARFLGVEDAVQVPMDLEGMDAALLAGRCLQEAAAGSPARSPLTALARRVEARAVLSGGVAHSP